MQTVVIGFIKKKKNVFLILLLSKMKSGFQCVFVLMEKFCFMFSCSPSYLNYPIAANTSWFISLFLYISFDKVAYRWFLYFQHALCLYQLLLQTAAIHSFSVSGSFKVLY